jgi:hypothetical protein
MSPFGARFPRWPALLVSVLALSLHATSAGQTPAGAVGKPSASLAEQCANLYPSGWKPPSGRHQAAVPSVAHPARGVPFADPVHGSCVVRASDHEVDGGKGFMRNDYSRRQAFNADSTRYIAFAEDGHWHQFDSATARHLGKLNGLAGDAEPQWHPNNPALLVYLPNNGVGMTMHEINVATGFSRVIADFRQRVTQLWPDAQSVWTKSEGSPSADHRYWAFQVDSTKWQGLGLFTYDLQEDRIVATYDLRKNGKGRPDHLSMSPSGQFAVVSWDDGVVAFSRDFTQSRTLQRKGEHSDIALAANGDDVYIAIDYQASSGPVFMTNLKTGERTDLFPSYIAGTATAMHFSGKAFKRPGWVLVSTYADYGRGGQQWLHRKLFALELKANPSILNLAHHQSRHTKYFTEPQATVNRDFTRILFNSNWGVASESAVDAYMIVLPGELFAKRP